MMEVVSGDNWSYKTCKAPVKSSTNKPTPSFYRPDALPVTRPTMSDSRGTEGKSMSTSVL